MAGDAKKLTREYLENLSLFEDSLILPESGRACEKKQPEALPGALDPLPASLEEFRKNITNCPECPMGTQRNRIVFGDGSPDARIVFVGEAPGFNEDVKGIPFVGRAGQLLNQMLADVGLRREDVYICNVLKCRPPENRDPLPKEVSACSSYLLTQVALIHPDIIVCLGRHAVSTLLGTSAPMRDLRGRIVPWHDMHVMVTYHPAYYLRNNSQLEIGMEDFRMLRRLHDELAQK